jgi:hypothetical protein
MENRRGHDFHEDRKQGLRHEPVDVEDGRGQRIVGIGLPGQIPEAAGLHSPTGILESTKRGVLVLHRAKDSRRRQMEWGSNGTA